MLRRLISYSTAGAIGLLAVFCISATSLAQSQCDARENVLRVLQGKYKEQPVAMGVTLNGGLVEVLASENGASWTIIVTTPQGMSCLVAAGEGWRAMEQALLDPET